MGQITISGAVVLFDDEDDDLVRSRTWHLHKAGHNTYARGYIQGERSGGLFYMHRLILSAPKGLDVDHKNGNGLDNRRANIRVCSRSQNNANKRNFWAASGIKGVYLNKTRGTWSADIAKDKIRYRLGSSFKSAEEAGAAYRAKAIELYGEFASS